MPIFRVLDVIALTEPLRGEGLVRGQVGTVVEAFEDGSMLVEFSDSTGLAFAVTQVQPAQAILLRYGKVA